MPATILAMSSTRIYALIDPRNGRIRYVGITKQEPIVRVQQALLAARKAQTHKARWLRGLTAAGLKPALVVIDEVEDEHGDEAERWWISFYRTLGAPLTNHADGGRGSSRKGMRNTPEHNEKIAAALRGHAHSDETRARIGSTSRGRVTSAETRAKLSAALKGRPKTPEAVANMTAAARRRRDDPEKLARLREGQRKSWITRRAA